MIWLLVLLGTMGAALAVLIGHLVWRERSRPASIAPEAPAAAGRHVAEHFAAQRRAVQDTRTSPDHLQSGGC